MFSTLGRRALSPAGGMGSVAALSMLGASERSTARYTTSQVLAARKLHFHPSIAKKGATTFPQCPWQLQWQRKTFTTKTPTKANSTIETATKDANMSSSKKSLSFVDWYEGHLESRPVVTKMCTGSVLWGIGDVVAQVVPKLSTGSPIDYDLPRTGRAVIFGFALHAPTSHVHYNFLEWLTQRLGITGLMIPVFKTIMEQFVYWGWISNAMYLAAMGAMQGQSSEVIYHKIESSLWGLMKAQWAFWVPIQCCNFYAIPVRHQLNVVLLTSVVWTALLSFWYPPEPKKDDKVEGQD